MNLANIIIYIIIMYIIYLYLLFNVQKFFPNGPAACMFRPYCYLLLVTCYLLPLIVKIALAQGCLVGGEQTCGTTLLLVVRIVPATHGNARPC